MNLTCMKTIENIAYSLLYFYSKVFTPFFAYCGIPLFREQVGALNKQFVTYSGSLFYGNLQI